MLDQDSTGSELAVIQATPLPEQAGRRPVPGRIIDQVQQGLDGADATLRALEEEPDADAGDYEINMRPTASCSGDSPAKALSKAAAWCEKAPTALIHAIGYQHVEDLYEGDEFRVTLVFSYAEDEQ